MAEHRDSERAQPTLDFKCPHCGTTDQIPLTLEEPYASAPELAAENERLKRIQAQRDISREVITDTVVDQLRAQRDQLLEALQAFKDSTAFSWRGADGLAVISKVDAAIAAATDIAEARLEAEIDEQNAAEDAAGLNDDRPDFDDKCCSECGRRCSDLDEFELCLECREEYDP